MKLQLYEKACSPYLVMLDEGKERIESKRTYGEVSNKYRMCKYVPTSHYDLLPIEFR